MKIYITHLLQILDFPSPFRGFEIKNSLHWPTMVAENISNLVAHQNFFHFYGPVIAKIKKIVIMLIVINSKVRS